MALGFDSDVIQNLKLLGNARKYKRGARQSMSTWDRIYAFFRWFLNPINTNHKILLPNLTNYKPPVYLNNLFNPNMNNVTALEYSNYDMTQDNDGVLSRHTTEYPTSHTSIALRAISKQRLGARSPRLSSSTAGRRLC